MVALLVFFLALAWVALRFYEEPMRAWLNARARRRAGTGRTLARRGFSQKTEPPAVRLRRTAGGSTKLMVIGY